LHGRASRGAGAWTRVTAQTTALYGSGGRRLRRMAALKLCFHLSTVLAEGLIPGSGLTMPAKAKQSKQ